MDTADSSKTALLRMGREAYQAILERSLSERGDRERPYSALKWWGRRFRSLVRDLLAASVLEDDDPLISGVEDEVVAPRASGKLVYDPFVGGGTIVVEAARLGFDAVGVDIDPAAAEVTREAVNLINGVCAEIYPCLVDALMKTRQRLGYLWRLGEGEVIHIFLARCPPCEAPMWVATRRQRSEVALLLGDRIEWMSYEEARRKYGISPTHPRVRLPLSLPRAAEGYVAYAVEVKVGEDRDVYPVRPGGELAEALRESAEKARKALKKVLRGYGAPIPEDLKEVSRLRRDGLTGLEQVFTWRQLLTLLTFINEAEGLGCGKTARLAAGYVARTASLLAIYYQPYGKVNPGLVIKSYWLPAYPVELNPLSYREGKDFIRSVGRGTLATFIRRYYRACSGGVGVLGKVNVFVGNALRFVLRRRPYIIMTDPPYPGYQSYQELTLLYNYFLAYPRAGELRKVFEVAKNSTFLRKRDYSRFIKAFAAKVREASPEIIAIFLGISRESNADIVAELAYELARGNSVLRIYWFLGESPGKLGRSKTRGVFVIVASSMSAYVGDIDEPLKWALTIIDRLDGDIDVDRERSIIEAVMRRLNKFFYSR